MLYTLISTKTHYHQVKAGVRVTAPKGKMVVQPTRAQFVETNKSSSSFKVKNKLHTTQHSIFIWCAGLGASGGPPARQFLPWCYTCSDPPQGPTLPG